MLGSQVTNKQTGHDPLFFRAIRLQQRDHSFRYSLCFPSVAIMAVHRNILQEDEILWELYADICSDVSGYSDNESLDSDGDIPTTSSLKQLRSSTGPLTPQFPHPFFLTVWVGTILNPISRPDILVTTTSKHRIQGGYSKFGPCMNILYRNLSQYTAQTKNCRLKKSWSHGGVPWNLGYTIQGKLQDMECWWEWWSSIRLYLQHGDILSWGKEVGVQCYQFYTETYAKIITSIKQFL